MSIPCLAWRPACAQDLSALSLDQLLNIEVVTASKFAQKVSEAPSSVTVVTAEEIATYGYRTLADLLRAVRGVYVAYDRNYSYLGTRGSGHPGDFNSRVLLLVDGQRLNDLIYDQGSIGSEFPIDMELIERVEYVPGPGSAIYGSSAFFGVINVITKSGKSLGGAMASVEAASYGARKARFSYGRRFDNGADLLLSLSGFHSAGQNPYFPEFDDAASNRGVAKGLDYDRYKRFFMKYSYGDLTLESYFGERTKGVPTASYGQQFNDARSLTVDKYFSATAAYRTSWSNTLDVSASLNFTQYNYTGDSVFQSDGAVNRDIGHSGALSGEIRVLSKSFHNHTLVYGLEVMDGLNRTQRNYEVDPYASNLDVNVLKKGYAVYLQDEFRLSDALIVNLGLRHDRDGDGAHSNSPRLALIYKATPDITAKFVYGTAFRSPNAYERYYGDNGTSYKSVPGLVAENIKTFEFITEYLYRQDFKSSISIFNYKLTKLISLATDPADGLLYYTNIDAASSRGVELEAERLVAGGARIKGSVSFQAAHNDHTGAWLSNSPRTLAKLNYSQPIFADAARMGLEVQYTSRRKTVLESEIGGFAVVNLTFSKVKLGKHAELSASIYNLFNKNYADPPSDEHFDNSSPPRYLQSIRQDDRVVRASLSYRF
ncbi:TonB-dependent receptor [Janthinobacterium sp.]|uniref:TonB-dependent receptor plug domain-containing protein n=1 Tax=Janthinobacterium sp. TaxID=1871054 RepID=UPI00293D45FA|nr:TonB-dependent receptor [Janthinobacterium sp.]